MAALLLGGLWLCPQALRAALPNTLNYQGRMLLTSGAAVADSNSNNVAFALYTASTGGTAIWTESQSGVTTAAGLFNVQLGTVTSLGGLAWDQPYWLGINFNGNGEMTPRTSLTMAPYAFRAKVASVADSINAPLSLTGSGAASALYAHNTGTGLGILVTGSSVGLSSTATGKGGYFSGSTGVEGAGDVIGGYFSGPTAVSAKGVLGSGNVYGVFASSDSAQGSGVYGRNDVAGVGVQGIATGAGGIGVIADSSAGPALLLSGTAQMVAATGLSITVGSYVSFTAGTNLGGGGVPNPLSLSGNVNGGAIITGANVAATGQGMAGLGSEIGVSGTATLGGTGVGVLGQANSSSGAGVMGINDGVGSAVTAYNNGFNGVGLVVSSTAGNNSIGAVIVGNHFALSVTTMSSSGYGIFAQAASSGSAVSGQNSGLGTGVYGSAGGSGTGVYASSVSGKGLIATSTSGPAIGLGGTARIDAGSNTITMSSYVSFTAGTNLSTAVTAPLSLTLNAANTAPLSVSNNLGAALYVTATSASYYAAQIFNGDSGGALYASSSGSPVVWAENTGSGQAIQAKTAGNGSYAIFALASNTSGYGVGVLGQSPSPDGIGIYGRSQASTGNGVGVLGVSPASPIGVGVVGADVYSPTFPGVKIGVYGTVSGSSAVAVYGNNGTGTGLYGAGVIALDANGPINQRGQALPSNAPAGQGRIYFDSTVNKFKVSESGSGYKDLLATISAPLSLTTGAASPTLFAANTETGGLQGAISAAGVRRGIVATALGTADVIGVSSTATLTGNYQTGTGIYGHAVSSITDATLTGVIGRADAGAGSSFALGGDFSSYTPGGGQSTAVRGYAEGLEPVGASFQASATGPGGINTKGLSAYASANAGQPGIGVYASAAGGLVNIGVQATATNGTGYGVVADGSSVAVSATSSAGTAVYAQSAGSFAPTSYFIQGTTDSTAGAAIAVYGQARNSNAGIGIFGYSASVVPSFPTKGAAIYGFTDRAGAAGLWGRAQSNGVGVIAEGNLVGLSSTAANANGTGVLSFGGLVGVSGVATGFSGNAVGVYGGTNLLPNSAGVMGITNGSTLPSTSAGTGVMGVNDGINGIGVYAKNNGGGGIALVAQGLGLGLSATAASTTGIAVLGQANGGGKGVYGSTDGLGTDGRAGVAAKNATASVAGTPATALDIDGGIVINTARAGDPAVGVLTMSANNTNPGNAALAFGFSTITSNQIRASPPSVILLTIVDSLYPDSVQLSAKVKSVSNGSADVQVSAQSATATSPGLQVIKVNYLIINTR